MLFPVSELRLTNGLQILVLEDHSNPLVAVQVWYHVGSVDEAADRHGFAHLFEHMMFRGTDRLGPTDHFDLLERVGGDCNAFTSFDETCYHETLPAPQFELALWLESERMAFLTVDGTGFTTERKVVEEERRMNLEMPYGEICDQGPPLVFGQHPYGHDPLGTFNSLRQATPVEVHAWWKRHYTPSNATLIVVGDVTPEHVRTLCDRYFAWIPAVPAPPREAPALTAWETSNQVTLRLANAPAPGVGIVWRTVPEGHPDALALELLATILGGDPAKVLSRSPNSSRLYRRLVVEEHVAVMAGAMPFGLAHGGVFGVGAALSPLGGSTERALTILEAEMERLRKDGVTQEEMEKARNQAISSLVQEAQTVAGKANLLGRAAVVGTGIAELNSRLDRLRRLTRSDLQRATQTHLAAQHALSVVVPGSGLLDQLSRLFAGRRQAEEKAPVAFAPETLLRGREGVVRPAGLPLRPPLRTENPPLPHPAIQEYRLTNGLRVLVVTQSNAPIVQAVLALPFGAWAEPKPGVASLALNVITKATAAYDDKAMAEELDRYGIQLTGTASHDDSRIQMTCLQEHAERAFGLLSEAVTRPSFPEGAFKIAASQAQTELTLMDTAPIMLATRQFERAVFGNHPYGRRVSGEPAEISRLKAADLVDFWRRVARPDRATLIVVGALTEQRALALAERSFNSWQLQTNSPSGSVVIDSALPPPPERPNPPGTTRIVVVDWPGASQSQIRIGGLGVNHTDPDKPIANLVSSYFGGTFGSRLMNAIRVKKGSTYGAGGGFEASRYAGVFVVSTFTKTSLTSDTVRTVLEEIRGLAERPPTAEELSLHKQHFLGGAPARFETPQQVAFQLAHIALNRLPLDNVQRSLNRIAAATPAQCEVLVKRILDPAHLVVVVVGDASVIAKDLAEIAPVTVVDHDGRPISKPPGPNTESSRP